MSYKDAQEMARRATQPRMVPEEEWDDHDKEFMSKMTLHNRKVSRKRFIDRDFTKPNVEYRKHREKSSWRGHKVNPAFKPEPISGTNHERHLARRAMRNRR